MMTLERRVKHLTLQIDRLYKVECKARKRADEIADLRYRLWNERSILIPELTAHQLRSRGLLTNEKVNYMSRHDQARHHNLTPVPESMRNSQSYQNCAPQIKKGEGTQPGLS